MPSASRRCSECGKELPEGSRKITCNATCRSRRQRRLKRAKTRPRAGRPEGARPEWEVYDSEQHQLMQEVLKAELAPYARDQITDDVVAAIGAIMELAPKALKVMEQDLLHQDPVIRGRAAQLILKYTMPEKFLPADVGGDNTIRVTLDVPTPDYAPATPAPEDALATDLRECQRCNVAKPEADFEAGAPRCRECQAAVRTAMLAEAPGGS